MQDMSNNSIWTVTKTQKVYFKTFLTIGGLIVADKPMQIWTILGPCVSVILHSPKKKISAMCHAQLVERSYTRREYFNFESLQYTTSTINNIDFKYVICSVNYMIEQFLSMGINKHDIQASVYGGARLFSDSVFDIGMENINVAFEILQDQGIDIVKTDVGGDKSRLIRHYSDTGITQVKYSDRNNKPLL